MQKKKDKKREKTREKHVCVYVYACACVCMRVHYLFTKKKKEKLLADECYLSHGRELVHAEPSSTAPISRFSRFVWGEGKKKKEEVGQREGFNIFFFKKKHRYTHICIFYVCMYVSLSVSLSLSLSLCLCLCLCLSVSLSCKVANGVGSDILDFIHLSEALTTPTLVLC